MSDSGNPADACSPEDAGAAEHDTRHVSDFEAAMSGAYVMLGRLSHVKTRHEEDTERIQAALEKRVGGACETVLEKIREEYETLRSNLATLYLKSVKDLDAHKLGLDKPTRARIELIDGQKATVERVETELKTLVAHPDRDHVMRELAGVTRDANKVLKSSIKLLGMHYPKARPITTEEFPRGRLHNLVIAPRRSGDRRKLARPTPSAESSPGATTAAAEAHLEDVAPVGSGTREERSASFASVSSFASSTSSTAGAAAAPGPTASRSGRRGCCRSNSNNRRAPGWDDRELPHERVGDEAQGDTGGGNPIGGEGARQACGHCACACQADDVWAAYRDMRKRYHALKNQADVEEVRLRVEECRREIEREFEAKKKEMQAEFDLERRVMESRNGLSQAETQRLVVMIQASLKECQAVQQEAAELREKVVVGEQRLERARNDAREARDEISERKQRCQILLARIRYLKAQTAACMENAGDGRSFRMPSSPNESDYGSDSDIGEISRRNSKNSNHRSSSGKTSAAPTPRSPPPKYSDLESDSDSQISVDLETAEDSETDKDSETDDGEYVPWGDGRYGDRSSSGTSAARREREEEQSKERQLEREREHLTREVNELTAQLAAAGISSDSLHFSDDDSSTCTESAAFTPSRRAGEINAAAGRSRRPSDGAGVGANAAHRAHAPARGGERRRPSSRPGPRHAGPWQGGGTTTHTRRKTMPPSAAAAVAAAAAAVEESTSRQGQTGGGRSGKQPAAGGGQRASGRSRFFGDSYKSDGHDARCRGRGRGAKPSHFDHVPMIWGDDDENDTADDVVVVDAFSDSASSGSEG